MLLVCVNLTLGIIYTAFCVNNGILRSIRRCDINGRSYKLPSMEHVSMDKLTLDTPPRPHFLDAASSESETLAHASH